MYINIIAKIHTVTGASANLLIQVNNSRENNTIFKCDANQLRLIHKINIVYNYLCVIG